MNRLKIFFTVLIITCFMLSSCNSPKDVSSDSSSTAGISYDISSSLPDITSGGSNIPDSSSRTVISDGKPVSVIKYQPELYTNTKGTKMSYKPKGNTAQIQYTADAYKGYTPSDTNNGPSGKDPKNKLYIMYYDHTDDHGGRISIDRLADTATGQLGASQVGLRKTYPNIKFGNQYGGNYYSWIESRGFKNSEQKKIWDEFLKITKQPDYSIIGGTYSQPWSHMLTEEEGILQFTYGLSEIKKYTGKKVEYYGFSENTGYAYLPQILNDFGFKGAIVRSHWNCQGYPPSFLKSFGWWQGPDGSAIKAIPTFAGDNLDNGPTGMQRSQAEAISWIGHISAVHNTNSLVRQLNLYYNDKKRQGAEYVIATVIEDTHFYNDIPRMLKMLEKNDPKGEKYVITTAEEMYKIMQMDKTNPTFMMTPNNWTIAFNAGHFGDSLTKALVIANARVDQMEKLVAFTRLANINTPDYRKDIDNYWKHILHAQAHDGHIMPNFSYPSFDALSKGYYESSHALENIQTNLINNITTNYDGKSIYLFNTQSFDRKEVVSINLDYSENEKIVGIKEAATGKNIPFDITDCNIKFGSTFSTLSFVGEVPGFGHNVYNIITQKAKQEKTLKTNAGLLNSLNSKGSLTLNGYNFFVTVNKDGSIESMTLKDGTKVIDKKSGIFTGRVHPANNYKDGRMVTSTARITDIEEGATLYRITVKGDFAKQEFILQLIVNKTLPYTDFRLDYYFEDGFCVGDYPKKYDIDKLDEADAGMNENNDNSRQSRLNINFETGFKMGNNKDPFSSEYNLHSANSYNKAVNVARYTPYHPEEFKRENESNTLKSWPAAEPNHIYNIFSRYWTDFSDTNGNKGFTLITQGNTALTYDGNKVSYVIAKGMPKDGKLYSTLGGWSDIGYFNDGPAFRQLGLEQDTTGHYKWQFRIIPHLKKLETTQYKLADGSIIDSHKEGIAYNYPLVAISREKGTSGKLPPKYRYMLSDTGSGTITSALRVVGNDVFARVYEYRGMKWAPSRFTVGAKPVNIVGVSMDLSQTRNNTPKFMEAHKINTYKILR